MDEGFSVDNYYSIIQCLYNIVERYDQFAELVPNNRQKYYQCDSLNVVVMIVHRDVFEDNNFLVAKVFLRKSGPIRCIAVVARRNVYDRVYDCTH